MLTSAKLSAGAKKGIQNASKLSMLWTRRTLDDRAAEYLLVVEIARVLYKLQKKYRGSVDIEVPPKDVLEQYEKTRGRLPNDLRNSGRIDIVISDRNLKRRIIVEVKKDVDSIGPDVRRIAEVLRRTDPASIGYGAVAFSRVLSPDKAKTSKDKVRRICKALESERGDIKIEIGEPSRVPCHVDDRKWYCLAFCLIVRRR